ncbi:MAG TPA: hypothetical protein VGR55_08365, partial [Candidatus Acidoferrum sp.]|nr:hypothetical protein [Candidatus Acidoferrum sp.]
DAPETAFDGGNKRRDCRRISDIEGLMEDFATRRFLDLRGCLGEGPGSAGANGDVSAFTSKFLGHSAPQTFTSSRDYRHATGKPQIHSTFPFKPAILSQNTRKRQRQPTEDFCLRDTRRGTKMQAIPSFLRG